jgi:hypothetical protein
MQKSWLTQFHEPCDEDWVEIVPGRAAVLRLRGPSGAVDLGVVYMDAHSEEVRADLRTQLAMALRPPDQVLTFLMGD